MVNGAPTVSLYHLSILIYCTNFEQDMFCEFSDDVFIVVDVISSE